MKCFQAIIFDMDGVIVDSEPYHEQAFREVFDELGYGGSHGIDFPAYYGRSDLVLWKDFIARHRPDYSLEELAARKQVRFLNRLQAEQPIFERVPDMLAKLAPRFSLALASGSRHRDIQTVLAMQDLHRYFPVVVSAQDVPRGKPAPDIFLRAAELMRVPASACCVVEDSEAGVEAALAAGMKVVAITNSLPAERLRNATHVVSSYREIEVWVE